MLEKLYIDELPLPRMGLIGEGPYDPTVEAELSAYLQARLMRTMLMYSAGEKNSNFRTRLAAYASIALSLVALLVALHLV